LGGRPHNPFNGTMIVPPIVPSIDPPIVQSTIIFSVIGTPNAGDTDVPTGHETPTITNRGGRRASGFHGFRMRTARRDKNIREKITNRPPTRQSAQPLRRRHRHDALLRTFVL
jgi:hypothetical protein